MYFRNQHSPGTLTLDIPLWDWLQKPNNAWGNPNRRTPPSSPYKHPSPPIPPAPGHPRVPAFFHGRAWQIQLEIKSEPKSAAVSDLSSPASHRSLYISVRNSTPPWRWWGGHPTTTTKEALAFEAFIWLWPPRSREALLGLFWLSFPLGSIFNR